MVDYPTNSFSVDFGFVCVAVRDLYLLGRVVVLELSQSVQEQNADFVKTVATQDVSACLFHDFVQSLGV